MPKIDLKVRLIIVLCDREIIELLSRADALERFEFIVRLDLEFGFKELMSLSLVSGRHRLYYYETNHHQKHVNY